MASFQNHTPTIDMISVLSAYYVTTNTIIEVQQNTVTNDCL